MISLFTPSLCIVCNLSLSYLSLSIPPSPNPPSCLLGQFEFLNIKNSSAFRKYDRMTGRQEYDRTKDKQRILDEYIIDFGFLNGAQNSQQMNIIQSLCSIPNDLCNTFAIFYKIQICLSMWKMKSIQSIRMACLFFWIKVIPVFLYSNHKMGFYEWY